MNQTGIPSFSVKEREQIYARLPATLLGWYSGAARDLPWRQNQNPYPVWISEIMLQQTRVEAVKAYYLRFLAELPTIEALANCEEQRLMKLWEGLGYYSRVQNLQKAAKLIMTEYEGVFPCTYEEICKLPGIGPYTAGAIASICFELPTPAVDGNVLRVISRITGDYTDIASPTYKKEVTAQLAKVYPLQRRGDFTQSLMELGATVCLPGGPPKCLVCPAAAFCRAYSLGLTEELPVKAKREKRTVQQLTVLLLQSQGCVALGKRQPQGLLGGMWELPNLPEILTQQQVLEHLTRLGVAGAAINRRVERSHIFTHVKWEMACYFIDCPEQSGPWQWTARETLERDIALPTAFKQFYDMLE